MYCIFFFLFILIYLLYLEQMPHSRRYPSSERASRSNYQDRYRERDRDRGRKPRHRRSPTFSSSSERERRGRGHRQDAGYARSRRYDLVLEALTKMIKLHELPVLDALHSSKRHRLTAIEADFL